MKTYKHLYPRIHEFENLHRAYRDARRGKRHKESVAAFEFDLEDNLLNLQTELETETYQPGAYHHFYITEPKRRKISAAPFRDRVVHHALCNVIEPIFEARFIHDSYACRVGKGTHRALDRCTEFAQKYPYVLKCDIQRFFPSIDHQVLRGLLARYIADPQVMRLIDLILNSGRGVLADEYAMRWFPGDDLFAVLRPRGLPIGNLTSQFWANVYLNELDQFVKRVLRCHAYVRYVDDFLLFDDDKAQLHCWRAEVAQFLERLRLTLHDKKSIVFPVSVGIDFLGFRVFPTHRRLRRENVRRFIRRFRWQRDRYRVGQLPLDAFTRSVQSWISHSQSASSYRLRAQILRAMPLSQR